MTIVSPSILSADFTKLGADCRMVLDADPQEPGAAVQRDVPVSFDPHHRQYGYRSVRELWQTLLDRPEKTEHDPFREL